MMAARDGRLPVGENCSIVNYIRTLAAKRHTGSLSRPAGVPVIDESGIFLRVQVFVALSRYLGRSPNGMTGAPDLAGRRRGL